MVNLAGTGFQRADDAPKHRLLANIEGMEKSGKTNLALTAPAPIAYVDVDLGSEGVLHKFQDKKEIWVSRHKLELDFALVKDPTQDQMNKAADAAYVVWSKIRKDWITALDSGVRTLITDTGTELWEILRMARFGRLMQVKSHHYGPVNMEFRDLIRRAEERDVNLLMLHKLKEEYKGDKPTGLMRMAGFNDIPYMMHLNVRCWKDSTQPFPDCFRATIVDSRQNPEINGMEMVGADIDFVNLGSLVYPESSEDDWK